MRLILENSTVCQIVDELVCYAPSSALALISFVLFFWGVGGGVGVVDGFFGKAMILANSWMFVSCRELALFSHGSRPFWGCGCGCCFSTESLILAQDERWRRA